VETEASPNFDKAIERGLKFILKNDSKIIVHKIVGSYQV
jgi:hypothetical protein